MEQHMQKQHNRSRAILSVLTCAFLGALLLSGCSLGSTGITPTHPSAIGPQGAAPTAGVSQTQQGEGAAQLQTFQQWIGLMQQYGGSVKTYQQQYSSDQQALNSANTATDYDKALGALQGHVKAIKIPTMRQESTNLQQKLAQDVNGWGAQHTYTDSYNGVTYHKGYQYDNRTGIGGSLWLQGDLSAAQSQADYQQIVENLNMWIYLFQQMKSNSNSKTAYNQVHQSDLSILKHFGYTSGPVIVVSLGEEALRAYQDGKLVKAFQVTTGQPDLPTPPGTWWIEGKKHPTVFKSTEPKSSPNWYPDTPITYAMQYHSNGYYLHDAWWRTQFGPGTNFPHQDPDGNVFATHGSHGCVNMSTSDAAWSYGFVSVFTPLVMY